MAYYTSHLLNNNSQQHVKIFFVGNGPRSQNGNQDEDTIPMQSFPDREQNDINNHDVTTPPETENDGTVLVDEGVLDQTDDMRDHLEYDIIGIDDTDGGTGSKMLMSEGSYLGKIRFAALWRKLVIRMCSHCLFPAC